MPAVLIVWLEKDIVVAHGLSAHHFDPVVSKNQLIWDTGEAQHMGYHSPSFPENIIINK